MAQGDFESSGEFTLAASGPGEIASVTVTDGDVAANSLIQVTPTNTVNDVRGAFTVSVVAGAGEFVVTADRAQLPEDWDFTYIAFEGAA